MYNQDLSNEGRNPNDDKHAVGGQVFEDVSLAVHFSTVDFVEEGHHDKGVEDDCKMLGWWGEKFGVDTTWNIEDGGT